MVLLANSQVIAISSPFPSFTSQIRNIRLRIQWYFHRINIQDLCLFFPTKNKCQESPTFRQEKAENERLLSINIRWALPWHLHGLFSFNRDSDLCSQMLLCPYHKWEHLGPESNFPKLWDKTRAGNFICLNSKWTCDLFIRHYDKVHNHAWSLPASMCRWREEPLESNGPIWILALLPASESLSVLYITNS